MEAEEAEILVGHTSVLTGTLTSDGNDVITGFEWYWSCPEKPDERHAVENRWVLDETDDAGWESALFFPEPEVGVRTYHFVGTRNSGKKVEGETSVTILAPNKVRAQQLTVDGSEAPQVISQIILYRFSRDGQEIGRDCPVSGFLQEKISVDKNSWRKGWQYRHWWGGKWHPATPAEIAETAETFYFNVDVDPEQEEIPLNVGVDRQEFNPGAYADANDGASVQDWIDYFEGLPVGHYMTPSHSQQVQLSLSKVCGGVERLPTHNGWRLDPRKTSETTISFGRTLMFVEPITYGQPIDFGN